MITLSTLLKYHGTPWSPLKHLWKLSITSWNAPRSSPESFGTLETFSHLPWFDSTRFLAFYTFISLSYLFRYLPNFMLLIFQFRLSEITIRLSTNLSIFSCFSFSICLSSNRKLLYSYHPCTLILISVFMPLLLFSWHFSFLLQIMN